jgi:uncharacterized protein
MKIQTIINPVKRRIHFVVNATDYPNSLEKRLAVRDDHLKRAAVLKERGFILIGGATLTNNTMTGSFLLINADNQEQVEEYIKTDIYSLTKVWQKVEIKQFKMAAISSHLMQK